MKIQFDPNLDFQKQAIEFVAGVFEGQEICQTNFTVAPLQYSKQMTFSTMENNLGIGNCLKLLDEDIHKNIRKIQLKNGLAPSEKMNSMDFTVEIETVTGKEHFKALGNDARLFAGTNAFEEFSGRYVQ